MSNYSETLIKAICRILRPLIKISLRQGFAFGSFSDLVKKMYVDAGFEEIQRRGQKKTVSNVSILTGINRKEVKRLSEITEMHAQQPVNKLNRIVRVLAGWAHDESFLNSQGMPKDLLLEGDEGSFTQLVKKYSGDMPVVAMLNTLINSGNIKVLDSGWITLLDHQYLVETDNEKKLEILGIDSAEFISSIEHNLNCDNTENVWFQRKASNTHISKKAVEKLQRLSGEKALALLEDLDAQFSSHESEDSEEQTYLSVGVYFYQDKSGKTGE